MRGSDAPPPLARPSVELTVAGVVAALWGVAGLAALLALEDPSKVLIGYLLTTAAGLTWGVWEAARAESRAQRQQSAARDFQPAPPDARREHRAETVRRALLGQTRMVPILVILIVLPSVMFGPSPGNAPAFAGGLVGLITAIGLENLRRARRIRRWQRVHHQTLLAERPPLFRPWARKRRRVFVEPMPSRPAAGHGRPSRSA